MSSAAPVARSGFTAEAFESFLARRDEPGWLVDRRRDAFATFQKLPMPSLRDEEWRRTDIRAFKLDGFAIGQEPPADDARAASLASFDALGGHYGAGIEHLDGVPTREKAGDLGGAIFLDLNRAVREHPELVRKFLFADAYQVDADKFAALHAAAWTGGTFLFVPKGVKVETPLFTLIGLAGAGKADLSHTLVVLEDEAEASLVQETTTFGAADAAALHLGGVELIVGSRAKLRYVNIQNWGTGTWHFSRERALVDRAGALQWTVGGLGSRLSKVNQEVALVGQGARAQVNGVMFTTGKQHLAYFTRQDHAAPDTTSDLLYKGGLNDKSRIVWKGMIRVEPEAQKTDAYQKNDSLILSEDARADSIPGLEIEANDVRCTHGATAGQVDEEMVFYSQARGLDRETAVRLIVEGFFANVYDRIGLEPVRETLREAVAAKLDI